MATVRTCGQFDALSGEDGNARMRAAQRRLGLRLVNPGHRERDEVFRHAVFSADSRKLSRRQQISIPWGLAAG